jgi:carboxylesterase type B
MMVPTVTQVLRHANAENAGTYLYRFDYPSLALKGKLGALRSLEAKFAFDTIGADPELTGAGANAQALAGRMSEVWISFAASTRTDAGS